MSGLNSQMRVRDREMVPRILVRGMFTVMAAALALVSFARVTDRPLVGAPAPSPVVAERLVALVPVAGGAVRVQDTHGAELARSDRDAAGFIGTVATAVERKRIGRDVAADAPVMLARRADGLMVLSDPATGWSMELIGFGKDNQAAFARLLDTE